MGGKAGTAVGWTAFEYHGHFVGLSREKLGEQEDHRNRLGYRRDHFGRTGRLQRDLISTATRFICETVSLRSAAGRTTTLEWVVLSGER